MKKMVRSIARDVWGRLARSLAGASVGVVAAAAVDSVWARAAGGEGLRMLPVYVADVAMLAPLALVLGVTSAVVGLVIDPDVAPSPSRFIAALRTSSAGRPADVAALAPLVVFAAFAWMTASAYLTRAVLAVEVPPPLSGIAIAMSSVGVGMLIALVALAVTPNLRRVLAKGSDDRPALVDPATTGGAALLFVAGLFTIGIATGTVSGEGGVFGIWGIFKRPELDLRAPGILLFILTIGVFAPKALGGLRKTIAIAIALLPLVATARAANGLASEPDVALAIERGAPTGKIGLALLRKATDRDHDGYSGMFAGGDCNDHDKSINPGATEIADDGIDQDCSGSDLSSAALAAINSKPVASASPSGSPSASAPVAKHTLPADMNLVLITIDTLRADLGFAGYARDVSPNLDKLAKQGTVFEHAYSLASYTGKSVGPLLIGKYPSETHRNWGHFNKFSEEDTFLAERLKKLGVHTMSVQGHRYFGKFGGLDRGFDVLDMSTAPPEGTPWDSDNSATSARLSDAALKLVTSEEHTKGRFFLWIHYLDPHADYLHHKEVPDFGRDERSPYDGEIAFTDLHIGRLLDAIAAAPWGAKTAIVITSDHGEAFGEHKMYRHGFELWEELVHVPLVMRVPGAPPSRISARRSAIDLVPTMLEVMGAQPASGDGNDFVSGTSMLSDLFLPAGEKAPARDVFVDMPGGPFNDPRRSFIHDDLKLTVGGARPELYDLASDPGEKKNLWGTDAQQKIEPNFAAMKARLREIKVTGDRK